MNKLSIISGHHLIATLARCGFVKVRQRGSHVVLKRMRKTGTDVCVVPLHRELALGTLKGVLKQAGLSIEEFLSAVKHR